MGRPAKISRDQILTAALELADHDGLDALTMGGVAERLSVSPMALYRHVGNKAELMDGLVERLLNEFPSPPSDRPWSERLSTLAANIRSSAHRHPTVFPLLLQLPTSTPQAQDTRDGVRGALREAGVAEDRVAQVERLVSTAILGFTVSEVAGRFRRHSKRQLDADFEALQDLLASFIRGGI
jgi:AcrR family transcriptional regulator